MTGVAAVWLVTRFGAEVPVDGSDLEISGS